ncbi:MAG: serine/threonine protein kinase, partial [Deltaproteobacteria bacterium]
MVVTLATLVEACYYGVGMKLPAPFGKYHLLEKIATGGMAEVYLAKAYGAAGFERLLVIKKILPHMAEDEEFITMFIDEARIASTLTHSNIVQITELGREGTDYYIAMEYVHGKDLSKLIARLGKLKRRLPIPLAVLITCKLCEGLDYAHNKTDSTGRSLKIVHRDISPGNVLLSYEGDVKLIDFGIAKAQNRMGRTTAGTLKGKFGYMSPEQVRGLPVDHRSDIFSVGILLYEMLTGERLFHSETDFGTLERVRNAEITPPTTYNAKIPPELEKTVMKALAREPEERFQSAAELHEAIASFLLDGSSLTTGKSLAAFLRQVFEKEIAAENERLARYRRKGYPW